MAKLNQDALTIPVIILAGGRSKRFGSPKAEAKLASKTLLEHIYNRLSVQSDGPILVNAPQEFSVPKNMQYIQDELGSGLGPLAGVHAAMNWARRNKHVAVATVSVDTPFLPVNLIDRLHTAGVPSFAERNDRKHPVIGLWCADHSEKLEQFLGSGGNSAHAWVEHCGAKPVEFGSSEGIDPFFNINTQRDMVTATTYLLGS